MGSLTAAWLTEVVLISYRAVKRGGQGTGNVPLPMPSQYAATFIVFGALGMIASVAPRARTFAGLTGWGFVIATFLNLYNPIQQAGQTPTIAQPGTPTATGATAG